MKRVVLSAVAILAVAAQAQTTQPDDPTTLVTEAVIDAPADEIWHVFTTAEGYKKLGVAQAKIDLRPGGMLWTSYDANVELGSEKSIGTEISPSIPAM